MGCGFHERLFTPNPSPYTEKEADMSDESLMNSEEVARCAASLLNQGFH